MKESKREANRRWRVRNKPKVKANRKAWLKANVRNRRGYRKRYRIARKAKSAAAILLLKKAILASPAIKPTRLTIDVPMSFNEALMGYNPPNEHDIAVRAHNLQERLHTIRTLAIHRALRRDSATEDRKINKPAVVFQ